MVPQVRILVISNLYPPHHIGGYELGCADVVKGLEDRGHDIAVLTSSHGLDAPLRSSRVYRWLERDQSEDASTQSVNRILGKELQNRSAMRAACTEFRPELVYVWNATGISLSVVFVAQNLGIPVCYFISDHWLSHWQKKDAGYSLDKRIPGRSSRRLVWKFLHPLLKRVRFVPSGPPDFSRTHFASYYLKRVAIDAGNPVAAAEVFHWGVDPVVFEFRKEHASRTRLLYSGQLVEHKGVETLLRALRNLIQQPGYDAVTLTMAGGPDYGDYVKGMVRVLGLEKHVRLIGLVPRDELPRIYREHDILVLPSIWEEPFSITLLEALSSGLAVVATRTGGTGEILKHERNALIFPRQDSSACANAIRRFIDDAQLFERLRSNGRSTIERDFRLDQMLDKIERSLIRSLAQSQVPGAGRSDGSFRLGRRIYPRSSDLPDSKLSTEA